MIRQPSMDLVCLDYLQFAHMSALAVGAYERRRAEVASLVPPGVLCSKTPITAATIHWLHSNRVVPDWQRAWGRCYDAER